MNRFRWIPAMVVVAMLTGCVPSLKEDTEVLQNTDEAEAEVETTIIPSMQLSDSYYRTLVPYKESASRGLVVSNLFTKYDINEVETGLMRLSQNVYDTENYYFQEGQYLDAETVSNWLYRSNQNKDESPELQGLNPPDTDASGNKMTPEVRAKQAPIYLAHIVEQNYLTKTDDNKVKIGGISIGLALNSTYYYQKEQYGEYYEEPIPEAEMVKKGKQIAEEVLTRLRARPDLKDLPIVIGLFKQEQRNAIIPGTYFAYSVSDSGQNTLGEWQEIKENYVTFPMSTPDEIYREANDKFLNFRQDIDKYFSNYTSVIGRGFYQNNRLTKLTVEIPVQFYGSTELIGFSQYLSGVIIKQLPGDIDIEVSITSVNGPEALILKERNEAEPFVHIYN
ncbi:CamS family sex pheromone protein [Lysinibacillus endophyticus]|uniref:CamS family sex pheromone protein n=1 Tax=Ureibacillus endophyticus TaxID=1978490 RepID=A0A494Z1L3_9BACL|nr:CamS family sex pheromone protein [Lysinibacillus endophyticus]MCP1146120.1 CamS family sex pheromone protein [Lysinibacillus endophyticus]RKQ16412.1 CamS family sex pheromone protein [Lysinibacillus endophyticus]